MEWDTILKIMTTCSSEVRASVAKGDSPRPTGLFFYAGHHLGALHRHGRIRDQESLDAFAERVRDRSLVRFEPDEGDAVKADAVAMIVGLPLHLWEAITGEPPPEGVDELIVGHVEHATRGTRTWIITAKGAESTDWVLWRSGTVSVFPPLIHEQFYGRPVGQA
jgi:hypothetical protein